MTSLLPWEPYPPLSFTATEPYCKCGSWIILPGPPTAQRPAGLQAQGRSRLCPALFFPSAPQSGAHRPSSKHHDGLWVSRGGLQWEGMAVVPQEPLRGSEMLTATVCVCRMGQAGRQDSQLREQCVGRTAAEPCAVGVRIHRDEPARPLHAPGEPVGRGRALESRGPLTRGV